MRMGKFLCILAGLAVCLVAPALAAQGLVGVTGEPYTAISKTTRVQTLADGNKITHETSVQEARDSYGRTYRESRPEMLPAGADTEGFTTVMVFDPVNRVQISWDTHSKHATVFHLPDPEQIRTRTADAPKEPVQLPQRTPDPKPQVERLGTQTVNGVSAEGTRITRTIPAGKQGNEQPIVITTETWRSSELKLVVRNIDNDPRNGITTRELTDIQQGEPDPALFQIPEGYTVKEQYPQQQDQ
jgi:hypothetical protein